MATYLDDILAAHRASAAGDRRRLDDLLGTAREASRHNPPRDFAQSIRPNGVAELRVIAEIKRRSPKKGDLAASLVPALVAQAYADGGAACLSVLTDCEFFGGSADDLVEARSACELPVLRKDFTVAAADICDARLMGADAVLLIVAALSDGELREFCVLAAELGMAALVETHDEDEVERALTAGATIIGVNQRDLRTFAVDTDRAVRVAGSIPAGVIRVAESGITSRTDAERLVAAGYDAILVGEALVRSADPARAVQDLRVPCS